MKYWIHINTPPRRNCDRKVIWFNPPQCEHKNQHQQNAFMTHWQALPSASYHKYELFNRNNIKISYSCMPNTASAICETINQFMERRCPSWHKLIQLLLKTRMSIEQKVFIWIPSVPVDRLDTTKLNMIMKLVRRAWKSVKTTT